MTPDLTDFGGGVQPPDPPTIKKTNSVQHSMGDKRVTAGWIGPCPERDGMAYVTKRERQRHRIRALDAYGISEGVLRRLAGAGVATVLVHEAGGKYDGRVLEFTLAQFTDGDEVPEEYLMRTDDPQRYVPVNEAAEVWPDHGDSLYLPRGQDVVWE